MKKVVAILFVFVLILSFTGCTSDTSSGTSIIEEAEAGNMLVFGNVDIDTSRSTVDAVVYDISTKIVYLKNRTYHGYCTYTAYYAPNGKPYKYNVETKTLEEIEY